VLPVDDRLVVDPSRPDTDELVLLPPVRDPVLPLLVPAVDPPRVTADPPRDVDPDDDELRPPED
jgi:hypothetical protein